MKDDPLANIATLSNVQFVMKDGVVYKKDGAAKPHRHRPNGITGLRAIDEHRDTGQ